jgi:hypothetical protein
LPYAHRCYVCEVPKSRVPVALAATLICGCLVSLFAAGCGSTRTVTATITVAKNTTSTNATQTAILASASDFSEGAASLVPTKSELGYDKTISSKVVLTPSTGKRPGFRSGWDVQYQDSSGLTIKDVDLVVYVYDNDAHALSAYDSACPVCKDERVVNGALVKDGIAGVKHLSGALAGKSVTSLGVMAVCRNIYVGGTTAGSATADDLASDTGTFVGAVYRKAMEQGMAKCVPPRAPRSNSPATATTRVKKTTPPASHPLSYAGNGGKTLPPVTIHRDSKLTWTNDGTIFQVYTGSGVPVNSQAHSGNTYLPAGRYTFQINAVGNWTIEIKPG